LLSDDVVVYILGIFAYLNYLTPRTREEIIIILINGLKRLEYRGYDSAGEKESEQYSWIVIIDDIIIITRHL